MTGFGAAEKGIFRVEVRSLNHRFTDVSIKLSSFLSGHEMPLRNMLKERFSRGKFDISISTKSEGKTRLKLNTELAREIYHSLTALKAELSIPGTVGIEMLLNYKELLVAEESEYDVDPLYNAFKEAMGQLEKMRIQEGRAMAEDILGRTERLWSISKELASLVPDIIDGGKKRFHERLEELLGGMEYDRERISQEIAIMIEKADITEELTRIDNHLIQFRKILSSGDTIGKRLDFLLQELNREANTIASKSNDYRVSNIVIDMKSEIEKIREQVQNIQ